MVRDMHIQPPWSRKMFHEIHTTDLGEDALPGAITNALSDLRGDAQNQAGSHQQAAGSLDVDVLQPMQEWKGGTMGMHRTVMAAQSKHAEMRASSEACLRIFTDYVESRKKAVDACAAAAISSPADLTWNPPPHTQSWQAIDDFKFRTASNPSDRTRSNSGLRGPGAGGIHSARAAASPKVGGVGGGSSSSGAASSGTGGSGSGVYSRLKTNFTSVFGSASDKLTALRRMANSSINATYERIAECQDAWAQYDALVDAFERALAVSTAELKRTWRGFTDVVMDAGRKYAVIQSSLLANVQYDTQMLAGKLETTQGLVTPKAGQSTGSDGGDGPGDGSAFLGATSDDYTADEETGASVKAAAPANKALPASGHPDAPRGAIEVAVVALFQAGFIPITGVQLSEEDDAPSDIQGELVAGGEPSDNSQWRWKAVGADEDVPLPALLTVVRRQIRSVTGGLDRFVWAMDAQRAARTDVGNSAFQALTGLLLAALDVAAERSLYSSVRSLMVIAQTFHTMVPIQPAEGGVDAHSEVKVHLRDAVRGHRVWTSLQFWESSVFESIGTELTKVNKSSSGGSPTPSGASAGGGVSEAVSFSQLGFYAYNMLDFGVSHSDIKALLAKYASFTHMSPEAQGQLDATVQGFIVERQQSSVVRQQQEAVAAALSRLGSSAAAGSSPDVVANTPRAVDSGYFAEGPSDGLDPLSATPVQVADLRQHDADSDADASAVGDGEDADASAVGDGEDADASAVGDGEDADASAVGDGEDADASAVGDGEDADASAVGDGEDADASAVGDGEDADASAAATAESGGKQRRKKKKGKR